MNNVDIFNKQITNAIYSHKGLGHVSWHEALVKGTSLKVIVVILKYEAKIKPVAVLTGVNDIDVTFSCAVLFYKLC